MKHLRWFGRFGLYLVRTLTFGWIVDAANLLRQLWAVLRRASERKGLSHSAREFEICCIRTTHPSLHRPDPCIYSQSFLAQQGLPVTWDNPDILIRRGGLVVAENELLPDTKYEVEATIWNNSYDGPAVGLRVDVSFLSFGVGTVSTPIGTAFVDVGVKGSAHHPGRVSVPWTTPATPGHFCIQVLLSGVDDANPNNNMGQNNVDVAAAASPAQFKFPLRNPFDRAGRFVFTVDTYRLPEPDPCGQAPPPRETRQERVRRIAAKHRSGGIGIPPGWSVVIAPQEVALEPGEEVSVEVSITPPDGFAGAQQFNLNALAEGAIAGGVTLLVTKS